MERADSKADTIPGHKLTIMIDRTLESIDQIRAADFPFTHAEFDEKYTTLVTGLDKFQVHLEILKAKFEKSPMPEKGIGPLEEKMINMKTSQISENVIRFFLDFVEQNLLLECVELVKRSSSQGFCQETVERLQILNPKVEALIRFFPLATTFDKNDIFALHDNHDTWLNLKKYHTYVPAINIEQLRCSFKKFLNIVYTGNAMTIFGQKFQEKGKYIQNTMKYLSGAFFFLFKNKAKQMTHLFYSKPDHSAFDVWDTLDKKYMLPFFEMTMTAIKVNQLYYIPKNYPALTLDVVTKAIEKGTWNDLKTPLFDEKDTYPLADAKAYSYKELQQKNEENIRVRLICNDKLNTPEGRGLFSYIKGEETKEFDTLFIHIHGGGWVAMSSGTHQIYLRHWSKMTNLPIFSIDYSLAPKAKYPEALNDCWQVYNWLLDNAKETFGIDPKKVIVVGDSAGANMGLGLSFLAMKTGRRAPDGLFLAYPALNLRADLYSPSLLKAINDEVIPYSFLELCLNAYLHDPNMAAVDPLVSPILFKDEFLKRLPPIRMMVGECDPLHDESWRFLKRLVENGNDCKLKVMEGMFHGCLNYDMPMGMPESLDAVKECAKDIIEILEIFKTKEETISTK